jgi:serine/threonine protein kinase
MTLGNLDHIQAAATEINNIVNIPRHQAIVEYYGWFQVLGCWAVIGMEYCTGTLTTFMKSFYYRNLPEKFKRPLRWEILVQITEGLALCHSRGLIHRDLKPDNSIPFSEDSDVVLYVFDRATCTNTFKIGDFGVARTLGYGAKAGTQIGTQGYLAPEVIRGERYDQRADMWSLGMIMMDINPFQGWCPWTRIRTRLCDNNPAARMGAREVHSAMRQHLHDIVTGRR